ncbi:MAG: acyl transferase [Chitinophagaceae bacterium]|nr:acyl transferase [Chitinophagaceae bacterium]
MIDRESFQKKILSIDSDASFNALALELFREQSAHNLVYKEYLSLIGKRVSDVSHYTAIPCLPVSFFKTQRVISVSTAELETAQQTIVFKSSGTTQQERSTHWVYDALWYEKITLEGFYRFFGEISDYVIIAYLPSYYENKESSLLYMINHFIAASRNPLSGYYDFASWELEEVLKKSRAEGKKVWIIGVTYALLDWAESNKKITLDDSAVILETGGMKGRRKELVRSELHERLKKGLGVAKIYSEYGMCEMLSQAYCFEKEEFEPVPWLRFGLRELNDPFGSLQIGSGVIQVFDLANMDSCCFLETQDIGQRDSGGKLKILGRLDNSDIRGCNLLYQN